MRCVSQGYFRAGDYGMLVVIVAASVLLNRTRFGRYVFAIGGNEEAARLAGINVARVKTIVYMISGGCAGNRRLAYTWRYFSSGSPQTGTGGTNCSSRSPPSSWGGTSLMGGRRAA